jgi:hypothetical protein
VLRIRSVHRLCGASFCFFFCLLLRFSCESSDGIYYSVVVFLMNRELEIYGNCGARLNTQRWVFECFSHFMVSVLSFPIFVKLLLTDGTCVVLQVITFLDAGLNRVI